MESCEFLGLGCFHLVGAAKFPQNVSVAEPLKRSEIAMNPNLDKDHEQSVTSVSHSQQEFNFDQWVRQVKPQLIASLQRRGCR